MKLFRRRAIYALSTLVLALASAGSAVAQEARFPTKPLRILVPFSAGALTDLIARLYAEKLTARLGQPVVVENRPGAGGIVASQVVLNSPPDGHTLLFVSSSHAVNPALHRKLPYDTERDFAGVALLASSPTVLVVNAAHPAKSLKDLIAMGRNQPGKLTYGSAGVGSATHLVGEYFAHEAGIKMLHVPFKGVQEAVTEVISGRLDVAYPPIALALPYIKSGQIRALAVTSQQRTPLMADTPTVAEQGLPGFDYSIWYAVMTSSKTPKPVLETLARAMQQVGELPDVREKLAAQGLVPNTIVLGEFDRFVAKEMEKLGQMVKLGGVKPEQ
jgi:tripartite-type tricarboxylate transporter receptor subunit TctC